MFPLMIVINIIMLVIKKTNTFNADLWNVWGKIFTAVGRCGNYRQRTAGISGSRHTDCI